MKREEFIKMCGILGIGIPLQLPLLACSSDDDENSVNAAPFKGKVIIIGAGAGGLTAGYLLHQQGIAFEILEASAVYGGRMRINTDFADFPIPLGAEWLETSTDIFQEIVNDTNTPVNVETIPDLPDRKFVNYSWYNFFEEYIVPAISDKITYKTIVQSIDYTGEQTMVSTQNGSHMTDRVVVAVPLKILQDGDLSFTPSLPQIKQNAISNIPIWEGFKAFFEFSIPFYDDEHVCSITPSSRGEKIYYNAAFGQDTSRHILGLFVVGEPAQDYIFRSGDDLKNFILSELDDLYSNQATPNYIKHLHQNWNDEPFIKSGYMSDHADWKTVRELGKSVADKLYFAGGPYTDGEDWVSVHAAAQSAKKAVAELSIL